MVTSQVSDRSLPERRGESCSYHLAVNFCHLPVEVPADDDLGLRILPDDTLHEADDCLRSLHHEAFLSWFQVYVEYADILPA